MTIFELTAIRLGADRGARITFFVDHGAALAAGKLAQDEGFATRLVPIPMPTDPRGLVDLLQDYVSRLGVGGQR